MIFKPKNFQNISQIILFLIPVLVGSQEVFDLPPIKLFELAYNVLKINPGDVKDSDVTFYLPKRNNVESVELISKERDGQVDVHKPTKFIIHGWLENYKVDWYKDMKDELQKYEDVNVIYVDYERIAKSFYYSSAENCLLVGRIVGRFIVDKKFPPENLHLIGHSLGSHVAGSAAKYIKNATGDTINRLSALDPAGPYFRLAFASEEDKLNPNDAEIVDVFHTDGKHFGYYRPLGTLDIYVNGGIRKQPGCHDGDYNVDYHQLLKNAFCSHTRSYRYFTQTINNAEIICKKCKSLQDVTFNNCSDTDVYRIVHQNVTQDMKGICTVSTGSSPPYS